MFFSKIQFIGLENGSCKDVAIDDVQVIDGVGIDRENKYLYILFRIETI